MSDPPAGPRDRRLLVQRLAAAAGNEGERPARPDRRRDPGAAHRACRLAVERRPSTTPPSRSRTIPARRCRHGRPRAAFGSRSSARRSVSSRPSRRSGARSSRRPGSTRANLDEGLKKAMQAKGVLPKDLLGGEVPNVEQDALTAFTPDRAVANSTSIALLAELGDRRILLTGDAWAPVLEVGLGRLLGERHLEALPIDLLKVAHHGSRNNTSMALLDLLACNRFLFSSSGAIFHHPDHQTVSRAIQATKRAGPEGLDAVLQLPERRQRGLGHARARRPPRLHAGLPRPGARRVPEGGGVADLVQAAIGVVSPICGRRPETTGQQPQASISDCRRGGSRLRSADAIRGPRRAGSRTRGRTRGNGLEALSPGVGP